MIVPLHTNAPIARIKTLLQHHQHVSTTPNPNGRHLLTRNNKLLKSKIQKILPKVAGPLTLRHTVVRLTLHNSNKSCHLFHTNLCIPARWHNITMCRRTTTTHTATAVLTLSRCPLAHTLILFHPLHLHHIHTPPIAPTPLMPNVVMLGNTLDPLAPLIHTPESWVPRHLHLNTHVKSRIWTQSNFQLLLLLSFITVVI